MNMDGIAAHNIKDISIEIATLEARRWVVFLENIVEDETRLSKSIRYIFDLHRNMFRVFESENLRDYIESEDSSSENNPQRNKAENDDSNSENNPEGNIASSEDSSFENNTECNKSENEDSSSDDSSSENYLKCDKTDSKNSSSENNPQCNRAENEDSSSENKAGCSRVHQRKMSVDSVIKQFYALFPTKNLESECVHFEDKSGQRIDDSGKFENVLAMKAVSDILIDGEIEVLRLTKTLVDKFVRFGRKVKIIKDDIGIAVEDSSILPDLEKRILELDDLVGCIHKKYSEMVDSL